MKSAIKRRFIMPPQITYASALPGKTGKHENCIFHSRAVLVHLLLFDFFNLFDSTTHTNAAVYDFLNLAINALCSSLLRGMIQEKGS